MKKIILYILFFISLLIIILIGYFSIFGIKTKNLNNQIKNVVKKFDQNLLTEFDEVQFYLNLKKLNIDAKTLNTKIFYKNENINIESIKTSISLKSFVKRKFAIKTLNISTKQIYLKNFISLIRIIKNSPEIYILQNRIKNGFLVADVKINFDENGEIKDDFEINGYVKDGQIDILSEYNLKKIDFLFEIQNKKYDLKDIKLSFNELDFFSEKISLLSKDENIYIEGNLENKILELKEEKLSNLINLISKNDDFENIVFSSKNNFSFKINNKFKIKDLVLNSNINIKNLIFKNKKKGKYFFPEVKDKIFLKDNDIKIEYTKNKFLIEGTGDLLLQNKIDKIKYSINSQNQIYEIKTIIELNQNPLSINFLNYEKEKKSKAIVKVETILNKNNEINFKTVKINEKENQILFENIFLDKDFKIKKIDNINLDYFDIEKKRNNIKVIRDENSYNLIGKKFNAESLIAKLVKNNSNQNELFKEDFNLNLKIDQIYLDKKNYIKNLKGNLKIVNNKVVTANIRSIFPNNERLNFFIKSKNNQKITTLFSENAEPLVKKFDFIKGYEGGSLDFYSSKKNQKSKSILKIYDFKLQKLPVLTKLLTLASLQGIADTLTGEGIRFNELEMNFNNEGNLITIEELYAIGPAISILMSGYVEKDKLVSLRGTLVPATTINKSIGSIPFLGKILVGSKAGEGVFGVSFKIKGHPDSLSTSVNPIKTLTPRFITRTLEKIKKN